MVDGPEGNILFISFDEFSNRLIASDSSIKDDHKSKESHPNHLCSPNSSFIDTKIRTINSYQIFKKK